VEGTTASFLKQNLIYLNYKSALGFSLDFDAALEISGNFFNSRLVSQALVIVTETVLYGKTNLNKICNLVLMKS
jgi:hypothetical protein